jgi:fused signal recognition particle receptor
MATSWQEILDLGARDATPSGAAEEEGGSAEGGGMFRRLRESLSKSRRALSEEISASLFERLDDETWERLEEALILADAGAPTTAKVVERLEQEVEAGTVSADGEAVRERLIEILAEVASTGRAPIDLSGEPAVMARRRRSARSPGISPGSSASRSFSPPATPTAPPRPSSSPSGRSGRAPN